MGNCKSLLTTRHFGSEYELLCTEISIQSLRLRLWGQLVGLDLDDPQNVNNVAIDREDIKPTIIETLNAVYFILNELKDLQQKYQLRKFSPLTKPSSDAKNPPSSKGLRTLSIVRSTSLRQRMRANQKEKSFISIAKWAICDAKKFDDKVKRLKSLIDGLGDIGTLATQSRPPLPLDEDNPPPYSVATPPITSLERPQVVFVPRTNRAMRLSDNSISNLLEHHSTMKGYLIGLPDVIDQRRLRARDKLVQLSDQQFKELRIDVFDELFRRQNFARLFDFVPDSATFHPKRNEARRKLSTVVDLRFGHLITDIVFELERRFPQLQDSPLSSPLEHPASETTNTRRWGVIRVGDQDRNPPPLLQDRPIYDSSSSSQDSSGSSPILSAFSESCRSQIVIFKSFRVSMEDPTHRVLPAALKKLHINAPWEQYALHIVHGDGERRLGMDEKPLVLFKELDKQGKKPLFMLRKIMPQTYRDNGEFVLAGSNRFDISSNIL